MSEQPTILHVDMDAFFASVEVRDDPSLRGKPVLVGGAGRRGVVAAASYESRKYGCRSAQPMAHALRLCPHAVVVPPRHAAYAEVSREVFTIFERFTPLVEGLSIDEAFLDLGGTERLWGSPRAAAESIRAAVRAETGLTCSVGIASVKFLAKIASGTNKPDGLTEIARGAELEFLTPLPISALWGVGPRTQEKLERRGIHTVGDLRRLGEAALVADFGAHGQHLHRLSCGVDERTVIPDRAAKSISSEDTYAEDLVGAPALRRQLLAQATRVADRLVAEQLRARCVHIKIRDSAFVTETRQCTLPRATDAYRDLYDAACRLLEAVEVEGRSFRLTGVGVADFSSSDPSVHGPAVQLDLLAPAAPQQQQSRNAALQAVLSAVRERHGDQALFPADAGASRGNATGSSTHHPNKPRSR
jgi:DNA polymerase IV